MLRRMQHVALDDGTGGGDSDDVGWLRRIGGVLRAELDSRGMSQRAFAGECGVNDGHLSRVIAGQVPGVPLVMFLDFERHLELPAGTLFVRAGLVTLPSTARATIEADNLLPPEDRNTVLRVYDALSAAAHAAGSTASARTARSTERS